MLIEFLPKQFCNAVLLEWGKAKLLKLPCTYSEFLDQFSSSCVGDRCTVTQPFRWIYSKLLKNDSGFRNIGFRGEDKMSIFAIVWKIIVSTWLATSEWISSRIDCRSSKKTETRAPWSCDCCVLSPPVRPLVADGFEYFSPLQWNPFHLLKKTKKNKGTIIFADNSS